MTTNADIVLPLGVILPLDRIVKDRLVNVPPLDNITELTFTVDTAGVQLLPVKSRIVNQLPVVIVGIAVPLFIVKLGAFNVAPPVVPNANVRVMVEDATNPPVTNEQPKLVASAMKLRNAIVYHLPSKEYRLLSKAHKTAIIKHEIS